VSPKFRVSLDENTERGSYHGTIVPLTPRVPDRPSQGGDDEAEGGRGGRDRGNTSVGSAVFVVLVCAIFGALVIGWLNASAAEPSATNYAPGVGALITGLIFGFVIGGIVGLGLWRSWRWISWARRRP
jgi:hypothetical protein